MENIVDVRAITRRLPLRRTQRMGTGQLTSHVDNVFVRLVSSCGIRGYGEAAPWSIFCAETPVSIIEVINTFARPVLLGRSPDHYRAIGRDLDASIIGCSYAKAAVDMALFDLVGKMTYRPLQDLVGGAVRASVKLSYSLSEQNAEAETVTMSRVSGQGYTIFKVKVGLLPTEQDAERLRTIRQRFPNVEIRLDFNQLGTVDRMARLLPAIRECKITVIEEPFEAGDLVSLRWLRDRFDGLLMGDESCRSLRDLIQIAQHGLFQAVSIKIQKLGGIAASMDASTIAAAHGILSYCGGTSDSALAAAAAAACGTCWSKVLPGCDLYFPFDIIDMDVSTALVCRSGELIPPTRPGIGVDIPDEWFDE